MDILKRHPLPNRDIVVGCGCGHRFMRRSDASWLCPRCGGIAEDWAYAVCAVCFEGKRSLLLYSRMSGHEATCAACVRKEGVVLDGQ